MYLIYSTSTTRKPLSLDAPHTDRFNWPKLLHLSWLVLDDQLKLIEDHNMLIKPVGFTPSEEMLKDNHLTSEELEKGQDLDTVLNAFEASVAKCTYSFVHNLKLKESIMIAALMNNGIETKLPTLDSYCLMQEGTYFCRIPNKRGGMKWPSLQELHVSLFNQKYKPTHNARADAVASAKCFIGLKNNRMLDDIFE